MSGILFVTLFSNLSFASALIPGENAYAHYEPFSFVTADGLKLSGHLARPKGATSATPVVLFLVGSGSGNRYENVPASVTADGKAGLLFQPIERALVEQGLAVVTYDKRGVSPKDSSFLESTVDRNIFATATANNLASDALSAFDAVKKLPNVDISQVGVLGHSEGTILALKIAESRPGQVKALFMLGMVIRSMSDIFTYQDVTNPMRMFYQVDVNGDGFIDQSEYSAALKGFPALQSALGSWSDVLAQMDKTGDQKISEQEWRYAIETQAQASLATIQDASQPWPDNSVPRAWFQQYLAEGSYKERELKFCSMTYLFQGEIDIQTPFEDALWLADACRSRQTPLASYKTYPNVGHGFSPRIGYRNMQDTVGPIDIKLPGDIATQAVASLAARSR